MVSSTPIILRSIKGVFQQTYEDLTPIAAVIAPLTKVPRFMEVVRKQPIGDLFAEAWLEGAL